MLIKAYCYYKQQKYYRCIDILEKFNNLYTCHKYKQYAQYLQMLSYCKIPSHPKFCIQKITRILNIYNSKLIKQSKYTNNICIIHIPYMQEKNTISGLHTHRYYMMKNDHIGTLITLLQLLKKENSTSQILIPEILYKLIE